MAHGYLTPLTTPTSLTTLLNMATFWTHCLASFYCHQACFFTLWTKTKVLIRADADDHKCFMRLPKHTHNNLSSPSSIPGLFVRGFPLLSFLSVLTPWPLFPLLFAVWPTPPPLSCTHLCFPKRCATHRCLCFTCKIQLASFPSLARQKYTPKLGILMLSGYHQGGYFWKYARARMTA